MDSQAKIKALRAEQRKVKVFIHDMSLCESIRREAQQRYTELGLEIDAELLRQEKRVISIV